VTPAGWIADGKAPLLAKSARNGAPAFWLPGSALFNVWTARQRVEKLRYVHRNPVVRELVQEPEQWPWSSYRSYAFGEEGAVRIHQWGEAKIKTSTPAA
jgi:putative transposase